MTPDSVHVDTQEIGELRTSNIEVGRRVKGEGGEGWATVNLELRSRGGQREHFKNSTFDVRISKSGGRRREETGGVRWTFWGQARIKFAN